jgi:hypothetical protein
MNRRMARTSETAMARIPRSDATPEPGNDALAAIYRRAIERYQKAKEGGLRITAPDSAKGGSENDSSAESSIP